MLKVVDVVVTEDASVVAGVRVELVDQIAVYVTGAVIGVPSV
jgi:hypothetical protein